MNQSRDERAGRQTSKPHPHREPARPPTTPPSTLAVRNAETGQGVASEIAAATRGRHVLVARLNLAERASIDSFVAEWDSPPDALVNNAGVVACRKPAHPGLGTSVATGRLGHFVLAAGLHR